ncbi:EAL domain-containing protein [Nocardioides anomalus]|uniref:EAL domain-containing protein n=1 Tax=Nocardioides anomalus TaxID=2712223 RepID=A0A6G6WDN8_9ACTN|nr:EAL domain-containing protein [Nocardioides anomalus]QIG43215.1 EAL domain-containing protein [Nocardioides anomalus]
MAQLVVEPSHAGEAEALRAVLDGARVRSVFQPIVALESGLVVGHEALARGPEGPFARPDELFGAARRTGQLAALDEACRRSALRSAVALGLTAPTTVFVNVEPEVLADAPLEELVAEAERAPGGVRVVLEVTERSLAARPAELLAALRRVRGLGWGVALDDVGVEATSLAFMALLRPDVVKLDLSLVQNPPHGGTAEIMHAVNAYAERYGASVLAEGIETEEHLMTARALGATLGQGWFFGRPTDEPDHGASTGVLELTRTGRDRPERSVRSPFDALPEGTTLRRATKGLLLELTYHLEREALRLGETCVVASTFQEARHLTPGTVRRYADLGRSAGFVCALGRDLPDEPAPGVRGASLSDDDPVLDEWDVVVISPHFATALLARDLGDDGPEMERTFEYALTYHRDTVVRAGEELVSRVAAVRPA